MLWCSSNVPDVVVVLQVSFTKYSLCIINQASHDLRIQLNIQNNPEHTHKISQVHVLRRRVFLSVLSNFLSIISLNIIKLKCRSRLIFKLPIQGNDEVTFQEPIYLNKHYFSFSIWYYEFSLTIFLTWQKQIEELYNLYTTK